jgi:flagellar biosynthesis protein FlhA
MDGASKFVRGDAIAGIVIVVVNIIGGLAIGVLQNGMSLTQAFDIFTKLTIGDGLVSQIPAFLISLAAGLLVTRGSSESSLPRDFIQQVFYRPRALGISACFLALLIFTNLPKLPLAGLAASSGGLAWVLTKKQQAHDAAAIAEAQQKAARPVEQRIEDCMHVDPMEMEIGAGLIRLADHKRGGDLLDRIQRVRHNLAADLGVVMPKVRIRDNLQLPANAYRIKLHDVPVAEGAIQPEMWLALSPNGDTPDIAGQTTIDPAFGTPAKWILSAMRDKAQLAGCTVVEPTSVLATHLTEVVRRHADEILTRDAVKGLIDEVKKSSPSVVDELIPSQMKLSDVQQVLQNLLRESVPIRQLSLILETLGDYAGRTKDPILLTDYVRHRLSRTICSRLRDNQNQLHVIVLDPKWEERIRTGSEHNDRGLFIRMSPQHIEELCRNLVSNLRPLVMDGRQPVLLVNPQIRAAVRQITATRLPTLQILSYNEISRDTQVESRGVVQAA